MVNKTASERRDDQFWKFVEETAREVDRWPEWMRGGTTRKDAKPAVNTKASTQSAKPPSDK